ncbi:MAG: hypothetical protein HUU50_08185 [Candidatus Brocadiae bacterium]|nr:hypothetical protein [Candidatus Brocadiia bacterium]
MLQRCNKNIAFLLLLSFCFALSTLYAQQEEPKAENQEKAQAESTEKTDEPENQEAAKEEDAVQELTPEEKEALEKLGEESRAYESNKDSEKAKVENGGWCVAWADDVSETDVARGIVSVAGSISVGNPGPFYAWIENLADRTIASLGHSAASKMPGYIKNQAKELARDIIKAAVQGKGAKEAFKNFDTVDFKAGAIKYSGTNYQKIGGKKITLSKTWGIKPYVAFRWRSSSRDFSSSSEPDLRTISMLGIAYKNGTRVSIPGNTAIYMVIDYKRRHISNESVHSKLFRSFSGVVSNSMANSLPLGNALDGNSILFKYSNRDTVYFFDGRVKHPILNRGAFERCNFDWGKIQTRNDINAPDGSPID